MHHQCPTNDETVFVIGGALVVHLSLAPRTSPCPIPSPRLYPAAVTGRRSGPGVSADGGEWAMRMRIGGGRTATSVLGLAGAATIGFCLGRGGPESVAVAAPPNPPVANAPGSPSDYSQRVVA